MEVTPGFIGNNSQGLAYVLPNSRTESYAIQLNQERAAQQRAQAILAAKQLQDENDDYAKHLYETKIPEHNAQWDAAINPKFEQYTKDAADYHAKTGKDPFTQPEFVQKRNDILSLASTSKQAAQKAVALSTLINNDRDNKLDPNDKLKIANALVAYNVDPVKNFSALDGLTASAKPYDITDAQKLLKPVTKSDNNGQYDVVSPDRHKHVVQSQEILADPKFDQLKVKNGINPVVGDVFSIEDVNGTHYPTDEPTLRRFVKHIVDAPELPGNIETFKAAGIDPADPNAEQKLVEIAMKQNEGYGKLVSGLADYADARAKSDKTRVFTADNNAMSHERLGIAKQRLAIAQTGGGEPATPRDMNIPYLGGKANVNASGYVPLSIPKKNFAGTPAYSLSDGKQIPALQSSGDYSVVGVGNFPFVKGTSKHNNTLAQPSFQSANPHNVELKPMIHIQKPATSDEPAEDYIIDYAKLPENIKNSKAIKQALSGFKPAGATTPAGTPLENKHKKAATDYGL